MKCKGKTSRETTFSKELRKLVGNDSIKYYSIYGNVVKGDDFKPEFKSWYKDHYKKEADINAKSNKGLASAVMEYYAKSPHDVNDTAIADTIEGANEHGYPSVIDREYSKQFSAAFLLDHYNALNAKGVSVVGNKLSHYRTALKQRWLNHIMKTIADKEKIELKAIQKQFLDAEDKMKFLEDKLMADGTITEQNLLAVYKELYSSDVNANRYLDEVLANPNLTSIRGEISKDLADEIKEQLASDAEADTESDGNGENTGEIESEFDMSIKALNSHLGTYTNYMLHVGERIQNYFNTLPVMTSTKNGEDFELNMNTRFGLAERMDARQCTTLIFNSAKFGNKTQMIESIDTLGKTIPGFGAFRKVAADLKANDDLATEFFTVFAKPRMEKVETVVQDGTSKTNVSNQRSDARSALFFDCRNDIKSSAIDIDPEIMNQRVMKLKGFVNTLVKNSKTSAINDEDVETIAHQVSTVLKQYYPTLTESAIHSYIDKNNNANGNNAVRARNALILINDIDATRKATMGTRQRNASKIQRLNLIEQRERAIRQETKSRFHDFTLDNDKNKIYAEDIIDPKQDKALLDLINKLLPYATVNTSFNSRNVYGNQSSDIINQSMIGQISNMMRDTFVEEVYDDKGKLVTTRKRNIRLEQWGAAKFRSKQYLYNPLLMTQYDDNGNVITEGLFTMVNGKPTLSQNFDQIFKVALFNGTSNIDNGSNILYSEMTTGDFLPTAYINFFNTTDQFNEGTNIGAYFLRTPSDAPKTFCIKARKYDTKGLYVFTDNARVQSDIDEIVNGFKHVSMEASQLAENAKNATPRSSEILAKYITGQQRVLVPSLSAVTKTSDGKSVARFVDVNDNSKIYLFKGDLKRTGNFSILENSEFAGLVSSTNFDLTTDVNDRVRGYYTNKLMSDNLTIGDKTYSKATRTINKQHPVFQALRNQFKQEMLNAAIALDHYFETDIDGKVQDTREKEDEFTPARRKDVTDAGYKFYHRNGKDIIETVTINGRKIQRLTGSVFRSSKFTLNKLVDGKMQHINYMDEMFNDDMDGDTNDGAIHFLYGGAKMASYLKVIKDKNGQIEDIVLSKEQSDKLDECMTRFIDDYVEDSYERTKPYKQFFRGVACNIDNVTSFALNNLLMLSAYDGIFEGDTKFYKDGQTVLKRAKEYQGSGIPQGISDYMESETESEHEIDCYLNNGFYNDTVVDEKTGKKTQVRRKVQDLFKEPIKLRNKFYGVTIANSVETNDKALKSLKTILMRQGLTEDAANNLLYGAIQVDKNGNKMTKDGEYVRRGGFTDTKVNDAQSYITFEEWVRRIAAKGQLQKYIPLIKKILDENSVLTAEDMKTFVQVQKNFYYDLWYDKRFNIEVPRQIKNAEFVLIPRFIKGTELEQVYNMMKEAGVDQLNTVETSKAANAEILTLWDNNEKFNPEHFVAQARWYKQDYSYSHLYTQQESPQHMNSLNKAAIQFVKKIVDNLEDSDPKKVQYFKLLNENIFESFQDLMDEFNIMTDEDGNIVLNSDGQIDHIDKQVFYDKFKQELVRRGMDSNMVKYVTLDDSDNPLMPSCMSNQLSTLECAVQSIFNSSITRQKLPGFHAEQVTNVGFTKFGDKVDNVSYAKELRYHPDGEGYIEVKLPYSVFGIDRSSKHYKDMTDEQILAELAKDNLDFVIGYRIPTEGKQSMCNMKVVGFVDDAYGSTIIVPNDWVTQTGSDFDIDSVYGFQPETYKRHDGKINRVNFVDSVDENKAIYSYIKYLRDHSAVDKKETSKLKTLDNQVYNQLQEAETEAFNNFLDNYPAAGRDQFKKSWQSIATTIRKQYAGESNNVIYRAQLTTYINNLNDLIDNNAKFFETKKELFDATKQLIETCSNIYEYISNTSDEYTGKTKEIIDELVANKIDDLNSAASSSGLMSFDDYKRAVNEIPEKVNTRAARNTKLFDIMRDILMDKKNLEENLSRSNFDGITEALGITMNDNVKAERKGRSPYNIYDQMAYQEDAMSGAKLKAFSVTLDTLCSVANTVKPVLGRPVYIVYNPDDYAGQDFKKYQENFGSYVDSSTAIRHTMYGYSKNNRNMANMILTSYSSQTTAYILDAIKEGAIPNVNDYTFAVFKTLANCGVDYKTSISFIMQDGIKRIVDAYNSNKSVYSSYTSNPIHEAIKGIAKELGFDVDYKTNVVRLLQEINAKYGEEFNKIFHQPSDNKIIIGLKDNDTKELPIVAKKCLERLKGVGEFDSNRPVERIDSHRLLFDLGVVLSFNNLKRTADEIGSIARCTNPDKFGAKQTVFATNEVFDNIHDLMFDDNGLPKKNPILTVNGAHILQAIYPGVENGLQGITSYNRVDESAYPTLYSYLKYSTATSILVARQVLDTQKPDFVRTVKSLASTFSGFNPRLDEKTYNDYQRYVLTHYYNKVGTIANAVGYDLESGSFSMDYNSSKAEERARIYGYGRQGNLTIPYRAVITTDGKEHTVTRYKEFHVEDISNPTQEELNDFTKLSPAQKVKWIKSNYARAGVFDFMQVQLLNDAKRGYRRGMQTIEYIDDGINSNVIYHEFYKAFNNRNPFVAMTAMDIIKYAVQVEGMRMGARAVNKVIDNSVFMNDFNNGGIGFNRELADLMYRQDEISQLSIQREIAENYLRGHYETMPQIHTVYLTAENEEKYGFEFKPLGVLRIAKRDASKNTDSETSGMDYNSILERSGIRYNDPMTGGFGTNAYVKVSRRGTVTLYNIHDLGNEVLLTPLSKLNANEDAVYSSNEEFSRKYRRREYYDALVADYIEKKGEHIFEREQLSNLTARMQEQFGKELYAQSIRTSRTNAMPVSFDINDLSQTDSGVANVLARSIEHFVNQSSSEDLYLNAPCFRNLIFTPEAGFGSIQKIRLPNGKYMSVIITKVDASKYNKHFLDQRISKEERARRIDSIQNQTMREAYRQANEMNMTSVQHLYKVTEFVDDGTAAATLEATNSNAYDFIRLRSSQNETEAANDALNTMRLNQIDNTTESMKDHAVVATREIARFANEEFRELSDRYLNFVEKPDGDGYFKMDDPEVQKMLKGNIALQTKYLNTLNRASSFKTMFAEYSDFNYDSEDAELKHYIDLIRHNVEKISKLPFIEANKKFLETYVNAESTNPLIRQRVIEVGDNYYQTLGSMWKFHDIAENGNPMLQTILAHVYSDLETKRMDALKRVKELQDILAEYEKKYGVKINDVIDDAGHLVQDCSPEFVEKLEELRKAKVEAARAGGAYGTIEHLKAKLAYDIFVAKHINQEAKPEYYLRKCALEKYMIENHPKIYSTYMQLHYKELEIYKHLYNEGITEEKRKELNDILAAISNLTRPGTYIDEQGRLAERPSEDVDTNEDYEARSIYDTHEANKLSAFLGDMRALNGKYFEYDAAFGFRELLKKNLDIMSSFEKRRNGVPTVPADVLESNETYVAARDWVKRNAKFTIDSAVDPVTFEKTGIGAKLQEALYRLGMSSNGKRHAINSIMKHANGEEGIYDERGVPDGTKLTEDEINRIKTAQEEAFKTKGLPKGSDRFLISSAPKDGDQFSGEFFRRMTGAKDQNEFNARNAEYYKIVTKINKILENYYDDVSGVVRLDRVSDDADGIAILNELAALYQDLRKARENKEKNGNKQFISENVKFETNKDAFNIQKINVQGKSREFQDAWLRCNLERNLDEDGSFKIKNGRTVANQFLYSYARPKADKGTKEYEKWVDHQRQEDLKLLNDIYSRTPTKYYYQAMHEAEERARHDSSYSYQDWYDQNHVYNPYTRQYEPLECWMYSQVNTDKFHGLDEEATDEKPFLGEWVPKPNQRERKVRNGETEISGLNTNISRESMYIPEKDMRNPNYNPNATSLVENYVRGSQKGEYDNKVTLTDKQRELRDYIQNLLINLSSVDSARRYFSKGLMPSYRAADPTTAKTVGVEALKLLGLSVDGIDGSKDYYEEIGYDKDITPNMPGTHELASKNPTEVTSMEALQAALNEDESIYFNVDRPAITDTQKYEEWLEARRAVVKHNRKITEKLMNKDWKGVLEAHIKQAEHYNSVQDNKELLYYLLHNLEQQQAYSREYGYTGGLKQDPRRSTDDNKVYETSVDENLVTQYKTLLRRLFYEQYKQRENKLTKVAQRLQTFTSANYMMMNIRGGIANVTVGFQGILGEALAGEFFSKGQWGAGLKEWAAAVPDMMRSSYSERALGETDAIIKAFKAVEYDDLDGRVRELNFAEWSKRVRDFSFSPQSGGENLMQNGVLLAMLRSHKLCAVDTMMNGGNYRAMNRKEYINYHMTTALEEVLTPEQLEEFQKFKEEIAKDKGKAADYAWFRKDIVTEFVAGPHCTKAQKEAYAKKTKEAREKFGKEFDEKPDLRSQLELGSDGRMKFKDGSELAKLDEKHVGNDPNNVSEALDVLGRFGERVRKVNNKIHGVYHRLGRADIEKTWVGSLIMQYHKHLPIGLMKRYMARGHWNEFRGSYDKGMVQSISDFFSLNFRSMKAELGLTDDNVTALESARVLFSNIGSYCSSLKTTWHILPESEKSNIRRNLGDFAGVMFGVIMMMGLMMCSGDDDDDSIGFNLALYEADRLASESFMYNPIGLVTEMKTLMSTPVAAQSIITDLYKSIQTAVGMIMQGEDFDPVYHSGQFAGRNKLGVYIERRIPLWNGIRSIRDTPANNRAYKKGDSAATIIPVKPIVKWGRESLGID